ncbi:MAG: AmmeMemoRadiSam system protein B [Limisphaerales bacterium]
MKAETESIRPAVQAGRFYPADPDQLRDEVQACLANARPDSGPVPKALIAPHAGYAFSGPIAGSAFASVAPARRLIQTVVLIGPAHYVAFDGIASTAFASFATPLGVVPVDREVADRLRGVGSVRDFDKAHRPEHSLEVQLPFLQMVLDRFMIIPLLVGKVGDDEVRSVIDALWDGPATLIVISSDLSHFHDYPTAQEHDARTAVAIESLSAGILSGEDACGVRAIRGFLAGAKARALTARTLDLRNSGDTAGSRDRVVGYGAFAFG